MPIGLETQLGVEIVNTLVTVITSVLVMMLTPGLQMWLVRMYWESVSLGRTKDALISEGISGFREFVWKIRYSAVGDRCRIIRDLLPYMFVIAAFQILPFSTSGVSATAAIKEGISVNVSGSLANPLSEPIETLDLTTLWALQKGEIEGGAAPFLLGSPELGNFGTTITGLDWSLYYSGTSTDSETDNGGTDLAIYGSRYTVEEDGAGQGTYAASTCLTVEEENGAYSVDTCDAVIVEPDAHEIVVQAVHDIDWSQQTSCEVENYAIFNQQVSYKKRSLTFISSTGGFSEDDMVEDTVVSATCANIFESIIEACIFEVGDHLYVGDWNPYDLTTCHGDFIVPMATIEITNSGGTLPSSDEFLVVASMLAEVVTGTGRIYSRQQLALVLGVFSRLAAMKAGVGTAHIPETVVIVVISRIVIVLWGLLFAAGCMVYLRERRLKPMIFIPSTAWDWFAIGARESLRGEDMYSAERPSDSDYAANYGLGKPVAGGGVIIQKLTWTAEQCKYEGGGIGGNPLPASLNVPIVSEGPRQTSLNYTRSAQY